MDTPINRGEHEEFVKRMEAENSRLSMRISELESRAMNVADLTVRVERLTLRLDMVEAKLKSLEEDVQDLKDRDGDMWRKLVSYAVTAIAGLAIGAVWNTVIGM